MASSGFNVYFSFEGLAELFRGPVAQLPMVAPQIVALITAVEPRKHVNDVTKWLKMYRADFCDQFDILGALQENLSNLVSKALMFLAGSRIIR